MGTRKERASTAHSKRRRAKEKDAAFLASMVNSLTAYLGSGDSLPRTFLALLKIVENANLKL
jgi:hypothetical protein